MRLKSLSLFGFKSFAHRTELIFPPGITAIVGPNGSGKSNILDAIIWVLGERSTKVLRSTKSADLLFAGNSRVKPASIAEVSLTFELDGSPRDENGDNFPDTWHYNLPAEIVITRRLQRNGESQFAINRVPCRLRDVQDLLFELGISPDSYAFVGQAEIDRLVFLSPQERREFIEQVAGIHKFQIRREDALEKLDRTEKNLMRLRDLIAELYKQREALSAEVKRAQKYEQLLKRQRELNVALLGWEHQVRTRRIERLREELASLKEAITETDRRIAAASLERSEIESTLAHMEEELQELQASASAALEETKMLENEMALCHERQKYLTQRRFQVSQQKASIAQRSQRLNDELAAAQKQLDTLRQQKSLFEEQEAQLNRKLAEEQQLVDQLEQAVRQTREEHFEVERLIAETKSQLASYEPLLNSLRARQSEVEREKENTRELISRLQQKRDELFHRHQTVTTEEISEIVQELRQKFEDQKRRSADLRHQLIQAREQLAAMRARLAALEEMELSLTGIPQGAKAILVAVKEGRLQGEFHLIAHLLQAPKGLEIAFESALGAAASFLVAPTFVEVQKAIEFLKATNSGRATFIALDFLSELGHGEGDSTPIQAEGVIGWASQLVQVTDQRFAPAIRHVLRNTLIVEDLEVARRLAPSLRGIRLITRSGEVITPTGAISGGSNLHSAGSPLLRQREREELSSHIRAFEARVRELEKQLKSAEAEAEALQSELAAAQRKRDEQWRVNERLSEETRRIATELEREQKAMERLEAEAARLKREIDGIEREMKTLRERISQLETTRQIAQQKLIEVQKKLAEAIHRRDSLNQQWQQLKLASAQWQTQLNSLERRINELTEALSELKRQETELDNEERTVENELSQLPQKLLTIQHRLEESRKRKERMEAALNNWREERKELIQRREEIEQQLSNLSAQRTAQSEELHKTEIKLTQAETELAEIERKLREEFQVSVEEAHSAAQRLEQKQTALDELERIKQEMAALGEVKLSVLDEYERLGYRINFLQTQISDLEEARDELLSGLESLERQFKERFREVLDQASDVFNRMVQRFWRGGEGRLVLTEGQTLAESGVEVKVKLPGKAEQDLLSLSGGEKAIVGLCFLFALLKINPAPFVLLDEVDAPLDDTNTDRFVSLLQEFSDRIHFIVITHNPITVQAANHLYGVTMEEEGVSKVLSLSLREALKWTGKD